MRSYRSQHSSHSLEDDSDGRTGDSTASTTASTAATPSSSSKSNRSAHGLRDRWDFAFRVALLGDSAAGKRQLAHSIVHGKVSKEASRQDAFLDQAAG